MVSLTTNNQIISIELEEYLVGVIAAEMPASFEEEAIKAQAVVSRSFVFSRKLKVDDTINSQVYQNNNKLREKWKENYEQNISKIIKAVNDTKGQVIVFENEIIHAFFFSNSNGKTNNSEDYWTTAYPYLVSVESAYDNIKKETVKIQNDEINEIFGYHVNTIKILSNYDSDYVKEVKVNNKTYTGRQIRELCKLKSSSFTIETNDKEVIFHTFGYGHGVGMSQYGAQGMALAGYTYEEIIKHYYQGVEIVNK